MTKDWELTKEQFDRLLNWLDPDRDLAGKRYEAIRLRLLKIFTCRGCSEADDLADETINRVTAKLAEIEGSYTGDQALYFYGVAQKVHMEYIRRRPPVQESLRPGHEFGGQTAWPFDLSDDLERDYVCLERCMDRLPVENRQLVLEYYQQERRAKIDHRKRMADQLGIAVNALRIRAHRIRLQLQQCVQSCLAESPVH